MFTCGYMLKCLNIYIYTWFLWWCVPYTHSRTFTVSIIWENYKSKPQVTSNLYCKMKKTLSNTFVDLIFFDLFILLRVCVSLKKKVLFPIICQFAFSQQRWRAGVENSPVKPSQYSIDYIYFLKVKFIFISYITNR